MTNLIKFAFLSICLLMTCAFVEVSHATTLAVTPPQGWKALEQAVVEGVWQHPELKDVTLSVQRYEADDVRTKSSVGSPRFLEKLRTVRSAMALPLGHSQWTVSHSRTFDVSGGFVLEVEGTYLDEQNAKHVFYERQYFIGKSRGQIQVVLPEKRAGGQDKKTIHLWMTALQVVP